MANFEIVGNTLVRYERAYTGEGGVSYRKETSVITKEEFIACYKAWIEGEADIADAIKNATPYRSTEDAGLLKRIEDIQEASAKLDRRLNALISCLYPTCISKDDVDFIDSQELAKSEDK